MKREMFIDEKIARNKEKRKARKDRDKNGIEKGVPHTLETLRIADPTISGTETLEWQRTISQDEFENIYSGEKIPKILITLSLDASPPSLGFCKELAQTFPNTFFLPRRKLGLVEDILPNAIAQEYSAVMVFNENQKRLNRLLVCHLPNGPTAEFKVFSAKRRQDLRNRSAKIGSQRLAERTPIERVIPGVYMGRFQTAIGKRVSRILEALFPVPQCDAVTASPHNRLVTFFNMRDYVFFRSHRYELKERIVPLSKTEDGKVKSKKSVKKVALRELGPRFTLKIVSVRKGVFGKSLDYYEWLRDKRVMEASRRQFNV